MTRAERAVIWLAVLGMLGIVVGTIGKLTAG